MLTKQEIDKFFEWLKIIEDIAPKIAQEQEQIYNSVFGYTSFFMATKDKYPSVHIDSEEGVSVEYYLGSGNSDSITVPLYAFVETNWQSRYRHALEIEFETRKEKSRQKAILAEENKIEARKKLYEELGKEFGKIV